MPIWIVRVGSSTPSSTALRNGPPWWNLVWSKPPPVSQWASIWIIPTGALRPTAFRIGWVIEWSPPTDSGATPAATIWPIRALDVLVADSSRLKRLRKGTSPMSATLRS